MEKRSVAGAPRILDGHNDVLLELSRGGRGFLGRDDTGHVDLPRALEGGFGGGLFACFIPNPEEEWDMGTALTITGTGYEVAMAPPLNPSYAREMADLQIAELFRIEAGSGGRLEVVRNVEELTRCLHTDVVAAVLHFEGAENLGPDPGGLEDLYRVGLRSLGLVWSRPNAYGFGVPFRFPASPDTGPSLTEAGRALVRECNRLGVLVDLSHLNERGFWAAAEATVAPLVATHSAAHALCPSTRNLTDEQLDAIRDSDGLVGLNFEVSALRADGHDEPDTPLEVLVNHVDYLVGRLGIGGVAFGSDFDGATMPREIGDVSGLPHLLAALRERGYGEDALRKLAHENWLRVLTETWRK
jgi:membrane dipeptidase